MQTTRRHDFVFAVPAVTEMDRSAVNLPNNAFVPILLPVDASMSEEAFYGRCKLLHAKSVRFLSWCIQQVVERLSLTGVEGHLLGRIDAVLSSLYCPPSSVLSTIHVVPTTPAPIPLSVLALTKDSNIHMTIRSHQADIPAESVLEIMRKSIIE